MRTGPSSRSGSPGRDPHLVPQPRPAPAGGHVHGQRGLHQQLLRHPPGAYQPEGTVTFFDGTTPLGTATLQYSSGATPQQATFTTSQLGAGVHAITVRYNGDAPANLEQFDPATSAVVNETVNGPQTPTTPPVHHRPHHRAHAVTHHHHPTPQVVMHP